MLTGQREGSDATVPDILAVESALEMRRDAEAMIAEAERMKRAANTILATALLSFPKCHYAVEGVGTVSIIAKLSPSFSQARLREYLTLHYSPDVAAEAISQSTTVTPIQYVQYNRWKEGDADNGNTEGE